MIGSTILRVIVFPFIVASAVLHQAVAKIQDKPLRISKDITVMGTTYVTGEDDSVSRLIRFTCFGALSY